MGVPFIVDFDVGMLRTMRRLSSTRGSEHFIQLACLQRIEKGREQETAAYHRRASHATCDATPDQQRSASPAKKGGTVRRNYQVPYTIVFDVDRLAQIRHFARREDISVDEFIQRACTNALKRAEALRKKRRATLKQRRR